MIPRLTAFRAAIITLLALLCLALPARAAARPNVILVMTDDQGYADFGVNGNPHLRTPHLDRFAREGVQFSRFYVNPLCSPTRASLLTGRYHYRTGVLHTSRGAAKMHGDEVTIAELLREAGYRTAVFGKWHVGDNFPMRATDQGFEEALLHKSGAIGMQADAPNSYFDPRLWHNDQPRPTKGYCTDVFFDAALAFIEQNRERPFFVYLPTNAPHTPLDVPEKYIAPYAAKGLPDATARVYGMIENIDENFGRLLATLDRLRLRENTLLLFLTDNGPAGPNRWDAGLRGKKGTVYEGGIRVPLFVQWPAAVKGGRTLDRIAAHIDLTPTVLEAAAVKAPAARMDGISLLPLLSGKTAEREWPDRTLFIQVHRGIEVKRYQHFAAITQHFKLLGFPGTGADEDLDTRSPVFELYDLSADQGEKRNVLARQEPVAAAIRRDYDRWFDDVRQTRHFRPGIIHLGADAEPVARLSRYQDGGYPGGITSGWRVNILRGGRYAISFFRGEFTGAARLTVQWLDRTTAQPLTAGEDTATFELAAGDGVLDVWLESEPGRRVPYTGNQPPGDVAIRRL